MNDIAIGFGVVDSLCDFVVKCDRLEYTGWLVSGVWIIVSNIMYIKKTMLNYGD